MTGAQVGSPPPAAGPLLDADACVQARERIRALVHHTPLHRSQLLNERTGTPLHLKCENFQKTGAFKVRGALNFLLQLEPAAKERGVITISSGNHAQAVAWAARAAGVAATVVMPVAAPRPKVEASQGYGAEIVLYGDVFEAFDHALRLADERGLTFIHPFDDLRIIAGQGTVGLEILEDLPDVATIVVPLGGGGQAAGIATAVAARSSGVRVYGVEPVGAACMRQSLDAGYPVRLDRIDTIAEGLAPPMAGAHTLRHIQAYAADVVTVSDAEIVQALELLLTRAKLLVEPSGAAAIAALLVGKIPLETGPVVAVLSGGNLDLSRLGDVLQIKDDGQSG